jgi:hypothetical protein
MSPLIIVIFVAVLVVLTILFIYVYNQLNMSVSTKTYDVPILGALNLQTLKNCSPILGTGAVSPWYTFKVLAYNPATQTGTMSVNYFENMGANEGIAVMTANIQVSGNTLTLTNFMYSTMVGSISQAMDAGPWTITLAGTALTLTGRRYGGTPVNLVANCPVVV